MLIGGRLVNRWWFWGSVVHHCLCEIDRRVKRKCPTGTQMIEIKKHKIPDGGFVNGSCKVILGVDNRVQFTLWKWHLTWVLLSWKKEDRCIVIIWRLTYLSKSWWWWYNNFISLAMIWRFRVYLKSCLWRWRTNFMCGICIGRQMHLLIESSCS